MQDEKWEDLLDNLEVKFGKLDRKHQVKATHDDVGNEIRNEEEWVEFETPMGKMKVSRITRPMIIDKKFHYTHSAGGKGQVEYVLSDTEKTQRVVLSKWNNLNNEWEEIKTPSGDIKF
jgi:hypothetical protein